MAEAGRAGPSPVIADLLNPVPARSARLSLAQGNAAAAARWTESRGLHPGSEPDYARELEYLVLARVLLTQHASGRAVALLERLRALAESQARTGSLIEIQALMALALAASGDEAGALDSLTEVLLLAGPQGYVRVFADEGPR
jgi:LuxR family maltose regulon positive regulatory protein